MSWQEIEERVGKRGKAEKRVCRRLLREGQQAETKEEFIELVKKEMKKMEGR